MDGAIPSSSADTPHRMSLHFSSITRVVNQQALQSNLFKQLLSGPAQQSSPHASSTATRSSRVDRSNSWDHRDDLANEPARDKAVTTEASSVDRDDDPDDAEKIAEKTAEENAEQGVTVGSVTPSGNPLEVQKLVKVDSNQQPNPAASDSDATDSLMADHGRNVRNQQATGGEINTPSRREAWVTSDAVADAGTQQDAQRSLANLGQPVDGSLNQPAEGQGGSGEESLPPAVQPESVDLNADESRIESGSKPALAQSASPATTDVAAPQETRKLAGATSPEDRKSRGERKEKWFERDDVSPSQKIDTQDEATVAQTTKAAASYADPNGTGENAVGTVDPFASVPQSPDSTISISQPLVTNLPPVGAALAATETTAAGTAGSSPSVGSRDAMNSLDGAQDSTSTSSADAVDSKGNSTSVHRADAKAPANETQRPDPLTQAERVRLVQRVSRSFARLGPMGGHINIKLHPPQLGSLNVQVRMEGRTMTAKLSTETSTARDAILESLPVLRGRLAEQGFQISSFHVEVADGNADAAGGSGNPQASFDQSSGGDGGSRPSHVVDYRRLAAQRHLQSGRFTASTVGGIASHELGWQMLAGVDLQA